MEQTTDSSRELNLTPHRSPQSVWERRGWNGTPERLAVSRMLLGVGGGLLMIEGMRRNTWTGRAVASLGGGLAWWALTGEGDLSAAQRWMSDRLRWINGHDDRVSEASDESFPASDAPSWTPTVGTGVRRDAVVPPTEGAIPAHRGARE